MRCATEIQLAIDKRNADVPEPNRMRFRIGINLGDVVVDGDNLMGDGVNVAARLEALAPPGGICVSEAIHAQVRDRLSLDFLDLGEHKVKNIARPVRAYRVPLASEEQVKSPFRGLDVFDFEHADLFFGRARAIAACTERLEQLAASGKAFLLIYGMSGSGKSSLLRAGLLPAITRPGAVAGIALWRRCLIRPSEGPDAIASLAAGLLREGALPELAQEKTAAELADLFRSAPDRALALIRAALGKAATAAGAAPSQARLALAIDQMEELFTTRGGAGVARSACAAACGVCRQRARLGDRDDPRGFLSPLRRGSRLLGAEGRARQLRAVAADRPGDRPDHPRAGARRRPAFRGGRRSGPAGGRAAGGGCCRSRIVAASRVRARRALRGRPRAVGCSPLPPIVRWAASKARLRAAPTKWSTRFRPTSRMHCRPCCGR